MKKRNLIAVLMMTAALAAGCGGAMVGRVEERFNLGLVMSSGRTQEGQFALARQLLDGVFRLGSLRSIGVRPGAKDAHRRIRSRELCPLAGLVRGEALCQLVRDAGVEDAAPAFQEVQTPAARFDVRCEVHVVAQNNAAWGDAGAGLFAGRWLRANSCASWATARYSLLGVFVTS